MGGELLLRRCQVKDSYRPHPCPSPTWEGSCHADFSVANKAVATPLPCRGGGGVGSVISQSFIVDYNYNMHYTTAKANEYEQKDLRKSLRRNMTPAEAIMWRALRGRGAGGYKFRRQQGIGPYVLDFYCPELRLCIELDGSSHDYKYEYDEQRTTFLDKQGIRVIRFRNEQVYACVDGVVAEILRVGQEIRVGKANAEE